MFLQKILNSVNQYFWEKLLGWHSSFLNSGFANRTVCGLPVCQIPACMWLFISSLDAIAMCSSTSYCYKVTSLNSSLLNLFM